MDTSHAQTTAPPHTPADTSTYVLLRGTSLDGHREYLVHYWPATGSAQLDGRLVGGHAWSPLAFDLLATEEIGR